MSARVNRINAFGVALAIATSALLTGMFGARDPASRPPAASAEAPSTVEDADGVAVPVRRYARIASASTVSDQVLLELLEPSRVVGVTQYTLEHGDRPWRYEGKQPIANARDLEVILQLRPDLVFVNAFADVRHVQRMREAGLAVFNLGDLRGVDTLLDDIAQIADVVGEGPRGAELSERFIRRLRAVAAHLPDSERRRALYASIYAGKLFGGTKGSSLHDVLTAAGLIDVAAEAGYSGSPSYTSEQLLQLDPPWIVTGEGGEAQLCRFPGLDALTACAKGRVRGVSEARLGDPGLGMVRAAEAVHEAVYKD